MDRGRLTRTAERSGGDANLCAFEQQVQQLLREVGGAVVEHTYNSLEPDEVDFLRDQTRDVWPR